MKRQTITLRLSLAHSAPRTRHAPLKRHFWKLSRRLLPARFQVRRGDRYGLRRQWAGGWGVLGLSVRREKETSGNG